MAVGDWGAARVAWEGIVHRSPDNSVALVELSRCIEAMGDTREALRILDAWRQRGSINPTVKASTELLIQAAKLNLSLGNRTAALDNLSLVINDDPGRTVLELARDTSEELGLYRQALEYHDHLEGLGFRSANSDNIRARLNLKEITSTHASSLYKSAPTSQRNRLVELTKRHPTYIPALEKLAEIELHVGSRDTAAEYLLRAARLAKTDISLWRRAVDIFLSSQSGNSKGNKTVSAHELSDMAVRTARIPLRDLQGEARVDGELLLVETLLRVNYFEEAERVLDNLNAVIERELGLVTTDIKRRIAIQRGNLLAQSGRARETADLWLIVAGTIDLDLNHKSRRDQSGSDITGPSPSLSTP
jgi:tetratricopeptide (TPR) repeat protein